MRIGNTVRTLALLVVATGVSRYEETHATLMGGKQPQGQRIVLPNTPLGTQTKVLGGLSCLALGYTIRQIVGRRRTKK